MVFEQLQHLYVQMETFDHAQGPSMDELASFATQLERLNLEIYDYLLDHPGEERTIQGLLKQSYNRYYQLLEPVLRTDDALLGPYQRLSNILSQLHSLRDQPSYTNQQVTRLQDELNAVEQEYLHEGVFVPAGGMAQQPHEDVKPGQAVLSTMLHQCHRLTRAMLEDNDPVSKPLFPIYRRLRHIQAKLDQLESQQRESINAAQLHRLRGMVDEIVKQKRLGKFIPPNVEDYFVVESYEGQEQLQSMVQDCQQRIASLLKQHGEPRLIQRTLHKIRSNLLISAFVQLYTLQSVIWTLARQTRYISQLCMVITSTLISVAYDLLIKWYSSLVPVWVMKNPKFHKLYREFNDIRHGFRKLRTDIVLEGRVAREEEARIKGWQGRLRTAQDSRDKSRLFHDEEGPYPTEAQNLLNLILQESHFILNNQLKYMPPPRNP